MKRGDIVLAAASGDYGKPRPWVVVQAGVLDAVVDSVIVCPVSSTVHHLEFRVPLEATAETGLRTRSEIMTDKIVALPRARSRTVIGRVGAGELQALDRALAFVLDIGRLPEV